MTGIIGRDRSIIPALDVDMDEAKKILEGTADVLGVGGYKIGPVLMFRPGADKIIRMIKEYTWKPLILDMQKWGTDVPDTADVMLPPVRDAGIENIILFPQAGPITEYYWIKKAQNLGLNVIVGGKMTHPGYLSGENVDEVYHNIFRDELGMELPTGFLRGDSPDDMYEIAARMRVTNFVVPGNKPEAIERARSVIENNVGIENASYLAPGFVAQGGDISEGGAVAGKRFHAIVGRGIREGGNYELNAIKLSSQL